ncbi:MAG: nuclear transport factor 2 family protein [Acidimicrobiia bacterium]|nr:nuclear transport factor 2 family protein [Acidimicrobiia bacterium]
MATADDIRGTIDAYLAAFEKGDKEGYLDLFADGATVEDPVGAPVCTGRDEISGFWDRMRGMAAEMRLELLGSPRVAANEAAFAFRVTTTVGDNSVALEPIDVMTFDESARITSMRAFWAPEDLRAV